MMENTGGKIMRDSIILTVALLFPEYLYFLALLWILTMVSFFPPLYVWVWSIEICNVDCSYILNQYVPFFNIFLNWGCYLILFFAHMSFIQ